MKLGFVAWKIYQDPAIKNDYITFMASTSIVEATKSPDVEVPASLGIQVEADRSLETVVAASDGSSWNERNQCSVRFKKNSKNHNWKRSSHQFEV